MSIPETFKEINLGMSNFDHEIDRGFKDAIVGKKVFGRHSGRRFNGKVFHKDGKFHEDVWQLHSFVETKSADTLIHLMVTVNEEYGWE